MIVYSNTKKGFLEDTADNIEDKIRFSVREKLNIDVKPGNSQYEAWKNSLGNAMFHLMNTSKIPDDAGVAIEYSLPHTKKRIDFIITGEDENNKEKVIIIELKQWSDIGRSEKEDIVVTRFRHGLSEEPHPSYQAWSYSEWLRSFSVTVYEEGIGLEPCAYLHNCMDDAVIRDDFYNYYLEKAPAFCKSDKQKLQDFISRFVKYGDKKKTLYRIENGEIRPSKNLADSLKSLLDGNREFIMIDAQKVVYETALALQKRSTSHNKNVLIIEGGPGTGKSVVAINLLVAITSKKKNARYVTKNAAPRAVFESKLTGTFKKTQFSNMFSNSESFLGADKDSFDALLVDEAHRLNEKSGFYKNQGENQIKELIEASKFCTFFLDEDQRVTWSDIGEKKEIEKWALKEGAAVHYMKLDSQFRCNGSDGYLAWLDNALQIRETANTEFEDFDYDFRILESPSELKDIIFQKNEVNNKARLLAGYCWDWVSRKDDSLNDISIPQYGFAMKWNLAMDGGRWIISPSSVNEVGCIHTCQGLETDYVGVIIGPDMIVRDGKIITRPERRAKTDASLKGFKKAFKENPKAALERAGLIIKNTYRTLMTRGMKGCYVFSVDKETNDYFKDLMSRPLRRMDIGRDITLKK